MEKNIHVYETLEKIWIKECTAKNDELICLNTTKHALKYILVFCTCLMFTFIFPWETHQGSHWPFFSVHIGHYFYWINFLVIILHYVIQIGHDTQATVAFHSLHGTLYFHNDLTCILNRAQPWLPVGSPSSFTSSFLIKFYTHTLYQVIGIE